MALSVCAALILSLDAHNEEHFALIKAMAKNRQQNKQPNKQTNKHTDVNERAIRIKKPVGPIERRGAWQGVAEGGGLWVVGEVVAFSMLKIAPTLIFKAMRLRRT